MRRGDSGHELRHLRRMADANKPTVLLLIDGGYHIVQFAIHGLILGLWH